MLPHTLAWINSPSRLPLGHLQLLDQTVLPTEITYLDCTTAAQVWDAIKRLVVRGAPAIGIAAAYGCVVGVQEKLLHAGWAPSTSALDSPARASEAQRWAAPTQQALRDVAQYLATSRPTAVNLFWALDRMQRVTPCTLENLLREARAIHEEDAAMCRAIGQHGVRLIEAHAGDKAVLTHCNAGALATGGIGTATAPIYRAHDLGLPVRVYADETRPLLQGARLTAFELAAAGVDVTLICDDMAAHVMQAGRVGMVIVGADRIARNGDTANKIGTYNLAVLAKHHGIPFYVAAPSSTFDLQLADGRGIPIEERAASEITEGFGKRTAPAQIKTYSPAFDVTPHALITGIVTERGVIAPVNEQTVTHHLA